MKTTMKILHHIQLDGKQQQQQPKKTSLGEDVEQPESSCTAGRDVKWLSYFGKTLTTPGKFKLQSYYITQKLYSLEYTQEKWPHENFYTNVYSSIIHKIQKVETA